MKEIVVAISRKELKALGACAESLVLYEEVKKLAGRGNRPLRLVWSPLSYVWFAKKHPSFCGWAIERGLLTQWSLTGANLNGADLYGANLARADLSYAYLSYAYLSGADLTGADLTGAKLLGADLTGALLSGALLSYANLSGADLLGAYYPYGSLPAGWRRGEDGRLVNE